LIKFLHSITRLLNIKNRNHNDIILSQKDASDFSLHRFKINNLRTLFISAFLAIEQFLYGLLAADKHTLMQKVFFVCAVVMVLFSCLSYTLYKRQVKKISGIYVFFSSSLAYFGLMTALYRTIILQQQVFSLPAVYLAVTYAVAVIFYFSYTEATIMYVLFAFFSIFFMKILSISPDSHIFIGDILSNIFIAWVIAVLNYRNLHKDFLNQIIIKKANDALLEKNDHIQLMNRKLTILSEHDALTGIYNRRKIDLLLSDEWNRFERYGNRFSIVILDVDFFKQVNDTYGHLTGDMVLKDLTKVLEDQLRSCDLIGRWGGEEFLIICKETNLDQACLLAQRLHAKLNCTEFNDAGTVTASFGVACIDEASELDSLVSLADKRLYYAKTSGRNKVVSSISCV
jgi:diguanylate cyclase (GGDEF)-like protein